MNSCFFFFFFFTFTYVRTYTCMYVHVLLTRRVGFHVLAVVSVCICTHGCFIKSAKGEKRERDIALWDPFINPSRRLFACLCPFGVVVFNGSRCVCELSLCCADF
ncbi:hypothetical protein F4778DRAFT_27984 [Xylariomycetidae sp. FL2044]|nr:hypothetical protein F4778DRAFT_27984 [Xylariomycetidae sp. FL2044]